MSLAGDRDAGERRFPATIRLHRLLLLDAALEIVGRAIKRSPTEPRHLHRRADLLAALGRREVADAARRRAIALAPAGEPDFATTVLGFLCGRGPPPDDPEAHSWLLHLAQFVPERDAAWHFEARRRWAARHADRLAPAIAPARPLKERALRLGYVSADLGRHPTGYFLAGVAAHHDRSRFEVVFYSDRLAEDAITHRLRAASTTWRSTAALDDEALARLIQDDGVDVLIDLAGHGFGHRLLSFARQPAAIQMSWIGSLATTGLKTMQWLVTDHWESPIDGEERAAEGILRLPAGRLCYEPPADAPPVASPRSAVPVLGCFAKSARLNPATIVLWARILRACPTARLHLKWSSFDDPGLAEAAAAAFAEHGIGRDRLILSGWSPHPALLEAYRSVDVALDPVGYSGGLTSCEALWMGVPVITLTGNGAPRRQTAALLSRLGKDGLIAVTEDDYLAVALELLEDGKRRETLRQGLRQRMLESLCDGRASCRSLEQVILGLAS